MKKLLIDPNAKGLIFDLDGTLINSMPLHYHAWCEALNDEGYDSNYPKEVFLELSGIPTLKIVEIVNDRFGWRLDPIAFSEKKEAFFFQSIEELTLHPEVIGLARSAKGHLPLAIGTGSQRDLVERSLSITGIEDIFDAIICADEVTHPKPHPQTFLMAAEAIGVAPRYCQVFEDAKNGLIAAEDAGMIATDVRPFIKNFT